MEVFKQRNFAADFFRQKLNFTGKISKIAFCALGWGTPKFLLVLNANKAARRTLVVGAALGFAAVLFSVNF